jgi:hypothetical protein
MNEFWMNVLTLRNRIPFLELNEGSADLQTHTKTIIVPKFDDLGKTQSTFECADISFCVRAELCDVNVFVSFSIYDRNSVVGATHEVLIVFSKGEGSVRGGHIIVSEEK